MMSLAWIHILLSNVGVSLALTLLAVWMGKGFKQYSTAHLLCLLALLKLITPPLLTLDALTPKQSDFTAHQSHILPAPALSSHEEQNPLSVERPAMTPTEYMSGALIMLWGTGALLSGLYPLIRIRRFHRVIQTNSIEPPSVVQKEAEAIASAFKLKRSPRLLVTDLAISPATWCFGRQVYIVLPSCVINQRDVNEWKWALAHEFAHVSRKDHLVRWLQWVVTSFYWWNPLVYWIHSCMRENEELCCDLLVLNTLSPKPKIYVESILSVAELLVCPMIRPVMASHMHHGGEMEKRMKAILNTTLNPNRNVMYLLIACASALLPFGLSHAENMHTETYSSSFALLSVDIAEGRITEKQAEETLQEVKKSALSLVETYIAELDKLRDEELITTAEYKELGGELEAILRGTPLQSFHVQTQLGILSGDLTEKEAAKRLAAFKKGSQNTFNNEITTLKALLDKGSINEKDYQYLSSLLDVFTK